MFHTATREQLKLRMAISGPSGSGKTYSALAIAQHLGSRLAVIDTERGSASRYAGEFSFDVCELSDFNPYEYIKAIQYAGQSGSYDVLIIDSLSHAWFWELDQVNHFSDWRKVRPLERKLIDSMLLVPCHLIVTMRTKTEYVIEEGTNRKGKSTSVPKKVGTAPIQSSGIEFEFDIAAEIDLAHTLTISKTRCSALSGKQLSHPGAELGRELLSWLHMGSPVSSEPEPEEQKRHRVRTARESVGLDIESVRQLLHHQFGVDSPAYLSSEQCDQLIVLIHQVGSSSAPAVATSPSPVSVPAPSAAPVPVAAPVPAPTAIPTELSA